MSQRRAIMLEKKQCFFLLSVLKFISNSPHSLNQLPVFSQMLPQRFDMGIHCPCISMILVSPHRLQKLFPCQDNVFILRQLDKQVEFLCAAD